MGTQPQHALHRTVVVVDVSAFSRRLRVPQEEIRRGLYAALEAAFDDNGLDWSATHHEDRGDGVFVLVPPDVPKSRVVDGVPHALLGELRRYNATRNEDARIRLRMAITAGEVQHDEHGVVGDEVTLAFRLLDSKPLREALDRSTAVFALIVSDRFYDDVVRPDPALDPESFRRVSVDVKEVHGRAWLHVPDRSGPARAPKPERAPRPRRKPPWARLGLTVLLVGAGAVDAFGARPPVVPPCPPPVQLNVLVSAEKEAVVRSLALELENDSAGCKEFNVLVFTGKSSDQGAAEALGRGWQPGDLTKEGPEPHVWLPDSTAEVRAIEEALSRRPDVELHVRAGVALSPVVLGASEDLAARIAPDDGFEWRHVTRPAAVDTSSGVGLLAATALAQAELGPDLDSPRAARVLHDITRRTSTGTPCVGDVALVGSEQAVADTDGCRVLYPRDGALVLDHPFVEVARPQRPNPRRQRIVHRLLEHLRSPSAQDQFKRAGFRDLDWNVIARPGSGVRPDRPQALAPQPHPSAVREAWQAASRPRVIGVAGDGSAAADLFASRVAALAGPRDRVVPLPLTEGVFDAGAEQHAHVVVLVSATAVPSIPKTVRGPVRVVAVGFAEGACAVSAPLYEAATAHGGKCQEIVDRNGSGATQRQEDALDAVARAAWGG
ncbi:substrate-binding domain-containing protein [Saccharothrix luteola]|uniref:substrate-binding domain-containing protein n=1 Tax=Saccharothrix luteola TaxID=2893018 RepID=UPI001E3AA13C|nr:substrate-binding domain-containing protein [Saccharothrix luteola]MCC8244784.1 substrate-binding domain-containing protein [Saccharothrix luteola]